ncbi:MAG: glutamine-hydrolyzing GMP synthase [Candidatus Levyibacteriota bacterium]
MILLVDFGSQTAHLISRRIQELGANVKIVYPEDALREINKEKVQGIILSGGPSGVYEKNVPTINPKIFDLGIPILSICYGFQLTAHLCGGKVIPGKKEYGPAKLELANGVWRIANGLPSKFTVWMSHGDEIIKLPKGFEIIGSTEHVPFAFAGNEEKKNYGLQFHPEVEHTEYGAKIFENFLKICGLKITKKSLDAKEIEEKIKKTVGNSYVIGAVSGGVDSTVAGIITAKAVGKRFIPIFVDNGLMREGTYESIKKIFQNTGVKPIVINTVGEMLARLKGIIDPEEKRKIIGKFYIEIFEREMKKLIKLGKDVKFLLQGTIYSDVIESQGTKHASKIKSHHNVGGLPKNMKLKLLEPVRHLYKDQVRSLGKTLGLSDDVIFKQPFPGPGYAVRIRGEVTKERLEKEKKTDKIVLEELEKAKILPNVFLSFPVMTNSFSTAVKGDSRFFGEVVAIRVIESKDVMTSHWSRLPYEVLQKISSRIINEVPDISRVVYDITTKPPATMEWE